jgi:uncharacterized secreted protein with C-terminal beta-propeller domain
MLLTVIFKEISSPLPPAYPEPLIYTVKVEADPLETQRLKKGEALNEIYKDQLLDLVAAERADELDTNDTEEVREGLKLLFAFEGEHSPILDWRE